MAVMPGGTRHRGFGPRSWPRSRCRTPLADVVAPRPERCEYTPGIGAVAQSVRAADS
jgi:hypothetical protein